MLNQTWWKPHKSSLTPGKWKAVLYEDDGHAYDCCNSTKDSKLILVKLMWWSIETTLLKVCEDGKKGTEKAKNPWLNSHYIFCKKIGPMKFSGTMELSNSDTEIKICVT